MSRLNYDVFEQAKKLEADGVSSENAKAFVHAINDALHVMQEQNDDVQATKHDLEKLRLAVKADVDQLKLELKSDIEKLKLELKSDIEKLKLDMDKLKLELKSDIDKLRSEMTIKLGGMIVVVAPIVVTLLGWLVHH